MNTPGDHTTVLLKLSLKRKNKSTSFSKGRYYTWAERDSTRKRKVRTRKKDCTDRQERSRVAK